jgi:hypothetical protein
MMGSILSLLLQMLAQTPAAAPTASPEIVLPGRVLADGTQGAPTDVVFKVDGDPVTRKDWTDLVNFRKLIAPKLPVGVVVTTAAHDIARHRAVLHHFADRAKELEPRIAEIKAKIAELKEKCGGDKKALLAGFGALCNQFSEDPSVRGLAEGGRQTIMQGQTHYPYDYISFNTPAGQITEPIPTLSGYEIFLVEELKKGAIPMMDVCEQRRLLIWWDADPKTHKAAKFGDVLLGGSKVEIVDPVFNQIMPIGLVLGLPVPFPAAEAAKQSNPGDENANPPEEGDATSDDGDK